MNLSNETPKNEELKELDLVQGINVWGQNQTVLEEQASKELELFSKNASVEPVIEDGELVDDNKKIIQPVLDIENYIKKQEELKKKQQYWKSLSVSDKSRNLAEKISQNQKKTTKRKIEKEKSQVVPKVKIRKSDPNDSDEYIPSDLDNSDDSICSSTPSTSRKTKKNLINFSKVRDDGCIKSYKTRLEEYYQKLENEDNSEARSAEDHYTLSKGFKVPKKIWENLYDYQQKGVEWLWQLHQKSTGGLLGDEMGLGKTVQMIAFLTGLEYSSIISGSYKGLGPTLIISPATVIHQWVEHFHEWSPELRVAVLHQSGTFQGKKSQLIRDINKNKGVIITTYNAMLKFEKILNELNWHYLVLDEGHKIRNPGSKITTIVKNIHTPHRIMLTGSPMQNNLQELWSLFDFTNPGMLGNLATFTEHFINPIIHGGFTNATPMQEATALSVATTLKNLITPFLMRRTKNQVQEHIQLPNKSEQVLFCSLTDEQRDLYKGYLMSDHVHSILGTKNWFSENQTRASILVAITTLRKICNHPSLYIGEADEMDMDEDKFIYKKSGKMIVVSALLKIWKKQNHRVLLFTQSRSMISVFENFLSDQDYKYLKMDGTTTISSRQPLINKFNQDSSYDVFLLTTRVGGLGVNLTGADRVIIYDPDWNPATDTQARERAWRIGQNKEVTIYRLLSVGTIEEKMYQRQVWKQLLSNKILIDPKTHRFFKSSDLHDLFSLPNDSKPETTNIFHESRVKLQENYKKKQEEKLKKKKEKESQIQFSDDKIQAMKNLAQQIAKSIAEPKQKVEKDSFQRQLEEERRKKLEEKKDLKNLTAIELMYLNREKAKPKEDPLVNRVDDCDTNVSFLQALEYSEKNAKLYNKLKHGKDVEEIVTKKEKKSKHEKNEEKIVDNSGSVEGELIEGVIRSEKRSVKRKRDEPKKQNQDEYVLEKLFAKKGVSGALHHDSIVEHRKAPSHLKIEMEAQMKADMALSALRKSRLENWRW